MIDKRIGKRIKQRREQLKLTQEEFADKVGVTVNYISTIERGASFPRCERLIAILNALEISADAIFCDVLEYCGNYREEKLSQELRTLPPQKQKEILGMLEVMIQYAKDN